MNEQHVNVHITGSGPGQAGNGMAVAGFVLALCALVLFWLPVVNFILWILGIVFSGIGLSRSNSQGLPHRGLAIAGLVIALVPGTLLVFVVFLIILAV